MSPFNFTLSTQSGTASHFNSLQIPRVGRIVLDGVYFLTDPRTYRPTDFVKRYTKFIVSNKRNVIQDFGMTITDSTIQLASAGDQYNEQNPLDIEAVNHFITLLSTIGGRWSFKDWYDNEFTVFMSDFKPFPILGIPDVIFAGYSMSLEIVGISKVYGVVVSEDVGGPPATVGFSFGQISSPYFPGSPPTIPTLITVRALDIFGNTNTSFTGNVTFTLLGGAPGGTKLAGVGVIQQFISNSFVNGVLNQPLVIVPLNSPEAFGAFIRLSYGTIVVDSNTYDIITDMEPPSVTVHHYTFTLVGVTNTSGMTSEDTAGTWDGLTPMPVTIEARDSSNALVTDDSLIPHTNDLSLETTSSSPGQASLVMVNDSTDNSNGKFILPAFSGGICSFTVVINVPSGYAFALRLIAAQHFLGPTGRSPYFHWGAAGVGWFKMITSFVWHASDGPIPVEIGAMIDDGTAQPSYTGTVTVSMGSPAWGIVTALYDLDHNLLPTLETESFVSGVWRGYVAVEVSNDVGPIPKPYQQIALHCVDYAIGAGGNSTPITWLE